MSWRVDQGDCVEAMAAMPAASVDAIVTDPPYGLGFMGRQWDALPPGQEWAEACLRVLKPGGHLLAFGGTRTYHRLAVAIEDAGFEIRDTIAWMYGSGFPKSLDVSKAIDKAAGAERAAGVEGPYSARRPREEVEATSAYHDGVGDYGSSLVTVPATPEAAEWEGWGTALKPAHEPIVVARKPLAGTVAQTVARHGTGALNIDGCRVAGDMSTANYGGRQDSSIGYGGTEPDGFRTQEHEAGRWPANVVLDAEAGAQLDAQTAHLHAAGNRPESTGGEPRGDVSMFGIGFDGPSLVYSDKGGASRFFYCAKADSGEREAGLTALPRSLDGGVWGGDQDDLTEGKKRITPRANVHPTVKPVDLMRWLVRLVTPPGGTVLDPFTGSGTTGCAAVLEGFDFIGVEREAEYVDIARARIDYWEPQGWQMELIA